MNPLFYEQKFQHTRSYADQLPTAGVSEKKDQFEISTLSTVQQEHLQSQQRLHSYELIWLTSGEGLLSIDTAVFPLRTNAVYLLLPGQIRQYIMKGDVQGYYLSFSHDFLYVGTNATAIDGWIDQFSVGRNIPALEPDEQLQHDMEALLTAMLREFANYYLLRAEILSGLLNILMIHFSRKLNANTSNLSISKDTDLVRNFKQLLKKHFITKKLVADYASELCVTANYLNRTVKKITGFTASYHIQQQIILEAKRQAIHSNVSMKEIAYFLGFDNIAHFSKFFKNNSGMNFTSFKKKLVIAG